MMTFPPSHAGPLPRLWGPRPPGAPPASVRMVCRDSVPGPPSCGHGGHGGRLSPSQSERGEQPEENRPLGR